VNEQTYERIPVEHFDDDRRYMGGHVLGFAVDVDRVEDERLVPGRIQRLVNPLRRLAVVQEGDARERI